MGREKETLLLKPDESWEYGGLGQAREIVIPGDWEQSQVPRTFLVDGIFDV